MWDQDFLYLVQLVQLSYLQSILGNQASKIILLSG